MKAAILIKDYFFTKLFVTINIYLVTHQTCLHIHSPGIVQFQLASTQQLCIMGVMHAKCSAQNDKTSGTQAIINLLG